MFALLLFLFFFFWFYFSRSLRMRIRDPMAKVVYYNNLVREVPEMFQEAEKLYENVLEALDAWLANNTCKYLLVALLVFTLVLIIIALSWSPSS